MTRAAELLQGLDLQEYKAHWQSITDSHEAVVIAHAETLQKKMEEECKRRCELQGELGRSKPPIDRARHFLKGWKHMYRKNYELQKQILSLSLGSTAGAGSSGNAGAGPSGNAGPQAAMGMSTRYDMP